MFGCCASYSDAEANLPSALEGDMVSTFSIYAGRTFKRSFYTCVEMQNATPNQMENTLELNEGSWAITGIALDDGLKIMWTMNFVKFIGKQTR